jgi:hypothetical protein
VSSLVEVLRSVILCYFVEGGAEVDGRERVKAWYIVVVFFVFLLPPAAGLQASRLIGLFDKTDKQMKMKLSKIMNAVYPRVLLERFIAQKRALKEWTNMFTCHN